MATKVITVPKNWNSLLPVNLNIKGPIEGHREAVGEIDEEDLFITFEAFSPPKIEYARQLLSGADTVYNFKGVMGRGAYRFLYPSSDITERISHAYGTDSSTYAKAMNNFMDIGASAINAWKQWLSSGREGAIYNAPVIWSSTERREFNIVLQLFAWDDLGYDIYDPIMFFRKNSYPKQKASLKETNFFKEGKDPNNQNPTGPISKGIDYLGGTADSALNSVAKRLGIIEYPSIFRITGGAFHTLNAIDKYNYYTLENISVDYGGDIKFLRSGIPMSVKLSLTFKECLKMFSNFFDDTTSVSIYTIQENNIVKPTGSKSFNYTNMARDLGFMNKTLGETLREQIVGGVKSLAVVRLVSNLRERAKNEAIGYIMRTIQGSGLYKKLDDALNLDPMHRLEMRKYTHAGFKRSDTPEAAHVAEVDEIQGKTIQKPTPRPEVIALTKETSIQRISEPAKTELPHQIEISAILKRVR